MSEQIPETTLYEKGSTRITNSRAVLGPTTYAMNNITSVSLAKEEPSGCIAWALMGIGLFAGIIGIAAEISGAIFIGVIFFILGVLVFNSNKPSFIVRIGSASGETDGLRSQDQQEIQEVVEAINEAIIQRG